MTSYEARKLLQAIADTATCMYPIPDDAKEAPDPIQLLAFGMIAGIAMKSNSISISINEKPFESMTDKELLSELLEADRTLDDIHKSITLISEWTTKAKDEAIKRNLIRELNKEGLLIKTQDAGTCKQT